MHFIVHCLDKPEALQTRLAHYDGHKAYLENSPVKIVVSGPLLADDETPIGSLFVVEASSKAEVVEFNENDPFKQSGVWGIVNIYRFLKRMDNR